MNQTATQQDTGRKKRPGMMSVKTLKYGAVLLAVVVLTALNAYLLNTLDVVGTPLIFAAALLVQMLLIIMFVFSLIMVWRTPLKIAWSILLSAGEGVRGNTYIVRLRQRYPQLIRWAGRRFSMKQPTGLVLTIGAAAAVAALLLFTASPGPSSWKPRTQASTSAS
ncbi:hypothetical protein [Paenarthrobacter sp. PH39-S1]|uniref:hypothetical protein n=1 Tax=Paenarthrobacter sp. PH39-S1 TaxID=3046204 RepID=UPI0024BA587D|nr:hypothetical protein [Paenarthrobacter sp. PH39-S1]MDJ0357424.1 hypothetical protein [Paenarthrobacter sp. PH39-S1]